MIEKYILTCCCWFIEGGVITNRELKKLLLISSKKYIPGGEEVLIGVGLVLIGMIIGFCGISCVFFHTDDIGMILTKRNSKVQCRLVKHSFLCFAFLQFYFEQDENLSIKHHSSLFLQHKQTKSLSYCSFPVKIFYWIEEIIDH